MPRNGAGTYSLPAGNPVVTATTVSSTTTNNTLSDIATALTTSLAADGQTPLSGNLNANGNKITGLAAGTATGQSLRWEQLFSQGTEADIASAATTDIGAQNTNFLRVTGTTTITSLGANYNGPRFIRFAGALTLTHNASTLILPGAANIITAAGDTCIAIPISGGWYVSLYTRANAPAFSAYASASQSITTSVATKVTLDTERFDTNSNFASSRFTPTVAGYYQINGVVRAIGTNAGIGYASIYKNGTEYIRGAQVTTPATNNSQHFTVSDVVYLNGTTDYVELYGLLTATSPSFDFSAIGATSSMSGALIRAS